MGKPTEINQVINTLQSNPLPNDQPTAQAAWIPTSNHLDRMNRLWGQLVRLYRHKWISSEGLADTDGVPTENFLMWAYEFRMTTNDSLLKGLDAAKKKVRDSDTENWPPTLEEFKGLCAKPDNPDGFRPEWREEYRYRDATRLEDITKKEAQAVKNRVNAQKMLASLRGKGEVKI